MAYAGQTIENPVTGEHITFLTTTSETNGDFLRFECQVEPGKARLAPHLHTSQTEHFTMLEGTLGARVGDEVYTLLPGQSLTLPARVVHQWWNPTDEVVRFPFFPAAATAPARVHGAGPNPYANWWRGIVAATSVPAVS